MNSLAPEQIDSLKINLTERMQALDTKLEQLQSDKARKYGLSPDSKEQASLTQNDEVIDQLEDNELHEIQQIKRTLFRIENGTYGVCEGCGEGIEPNRLKALPTADHCLACQKN